jgi:hypothetical protein
MSSDVGLLTDAAVVGRMVEDFLHSDIGLYLVQCADAEIDKGVEALKKANAENPSEVRSAQNQVICGEYIKQWLEEAVSAGLRAQQILEDRQLGVSE